MGLGPSGATWPFSYGRGVHVRMLRVPIGGAGTRGKGVRPANCLLVTAQLEQCERMRKNSCTRGSRSAFQSKQV